MRPNLQTADDGAVLGYHVMMRCEDDRAVAREPATLRQASRALLRIGKKHGLAAFRLVDSHVHSLVVGDRKNAGLYARYAQSALHQELRLPVALASRIKPVRSPRHFRNTVQYILNQENHHSAPLDTLHEGSTLLDFLGMRQIDSQSAIAVMRKMLPRLTAETLLDWAKIKPFHDVTPDLAHLKDAVLSAFAINNLTENTPDHRRARRAAIHSVELTQKQIGSLLSLSVRTVIRLQKLPPVPDDVQAIQLQMKFRTAMHQPPGKPFI